MRRHAAFLPAAAGRCLTLLLGAGAACTPPAAVARYAASAAQVTAKLPDASASLAASCRRTQSYRLRRAGGAWYGDDSAAAACAGRDSALRDVARANRVLAAYLSALAKLAGVKDDALGASVRALGDAAAETGGIERDQADAVGALARFAATRASGGYRRARLRAAIAAQNANVQAVTAALHEILARDFTRYLSDDASAQAAFYRASLAESGVRDPLGAILVRDSFDDRQAALMRRVDAIDALGRAVLVVGRGHQRLYDARDHLGAKELLAAIVSNARDLDAAIAKVDKAF